MARREGGMKGLIDVPVIGNGFRQVRTMQRDRVGALHRFNREVGDIGRFSFFGDVVLVNTPELAHDVLVTRARSFEKSPILRGALHPLVGQGLFTSDGELWRKQRRLMAPLFHASVLGSFAADMAAATERAAEGLRDGETVDAARETTRITMAIAGRTLFGIDTFAETDELGAALTYALDWAGEQSSSLTLVVQARVSVGLSRVAEHLPRPWRERTQALSESAVIPIRWPGSRSRRLRSALAVLDARVSRMIEDRRAAPGGSSPPFAPHPHRRHDVLSLLLSARDEDGGAMSDKQVRDEVLTLFVAGHETTANALAWALCLLAQHPSVLARLQAEADALGRTPTVDDLPRLPLALQVFKESMRLYPPVYLFGRVATTEVDVGPFRLPRGTIVLVSPFALHRNPSLWTDPERFDPERFRAEEEAKRHRCTFIPFGAGPRTCIGLSFALMEGPIVLATLLRRATFELVDPRGAEPEPSATLRPRGGLPMRVRLRRPAPHRSLSDAAS
jgi:cytochrome P450